MMLDPGGLILDFVHLAAVIAVLGGISFLLVVSLPVIKGFLPEDQFQKLFAKILGRAHFFELYAYAIIFSTGGWMLTRFKIDGGLNYFHEYGAIFFTKLGFAILVFLVFYWTYNWGNISYKNERPRMET